MFWLLGRYVTLIFYQLSCTCQFRYYVCNYTSFIYTGLIILFSFICQVIPQAICTRYGLAVGANFVWLVRFLMIICYPIAYPIGKVKSSQNFITICECEICIVVAHWRWFQRKLQGSPPPLCGKNCSHKPLLYPLSYYCYLSTFVSYKTELQSEALGSLSSFVYVP